MRMIRAVGAVILMALVQQFVCQQELLCTKATDLGILLDSSLDIMSQWQNVLAFSNAMVDAFNIGSTDTRVGIVTFNSESVMVLGFDTLKGNNLTEANIKERIATMQPKRGNNRYIDKALRYANTELFNSTRGMRKEPDVLKVLVVLLGGKRTQPNNSTPIRQATQSLRFKGVVIFAIGVSQLAEVDNKELAQIASRPENVMNAKTFAESINLAEEVAKLACGIKILEVRTKRQVTMQVKQKSYRYPGTRLQHVLCYEQ